MQKLLEEIVAVLPEVQVVGDCDKIIKDITADSREVREGSLFICLKGAHVDGHNTWSRLLRLVPVQLWLRMFQRYVLMD